MTLKASVYVIDELLAFSPSCIELKVSLSCMCYKVVSGSGEEPIIRSNIQHFSHFWYRYIFWLFADKLNYLRIYYIKLFIFSININLKSNK